jgi:hypothetical protein
MCVRDLNVERAMCFLELVAVTSMQPEPDLEGTAARETTRHTRGHVCRPLSHDHAMRILQFGV